ncbi:hypothetical protein IHE49_04110 [Rhodanobacter sp. 7MK24]|uniref:hypothetical protein n=1 Tax=Rhodanobacter sp. 7MK24 TaxID=2775922 RepID=UPI0017862788|nr:hypothetical protein [Rhodanobacter sp. 7MK24]MBD8879661.1 hypothetical protein [Rhodanobacter sp. 7MK24]
MLWVDVFAPWKKSSWSTATSETLQTSFDPACVLPHRLRAESSTPDAAQKRQSIHRGVSYAACYGSKPDALRRYLGVLPK